MSKITTLLLLPNTLFSEKHFPENIKNIILWEHPHYFVDYKFNKKKLLFHRASMTFYYEALSEKYNVTYIKYNEKFKQSENIYYFDPVNKIKISGVLIPKNPSFLLTAKDLLDYNKETDTFYFSSFYKFFKEKLNILEDIPSQDKHNRKVIPKDLELPVFKNFNKDNLTTLSGSINQDFPDNYGNTDDLVFPLTHTDAMSNFKNFLRYKLDNFGDYQDYVRENDSFLFHSVISSSLNSGLLSISDVLKKVRKYKSKTDINNYEGFVRQLCWREYQRYCYIYFDFKGLNYLKLNKDIPKSFYTGKTKNTMVNSLIKKAFDTGYLNHIERLMFIGNFMVLNEIKPEDTHKWFMEFSIDSYEWVMAQNVLDMVCFVSGGKTTRRPYISSSSYVKRMSDFKLGDWVDQWDEVYMKFIKRKKKLLWKFRYFIRALYDI